MLVYKGIRYEVPGVSTLNYLDDEVVKFKARGERKATKHIVWHENAGMYRSIMEKSLLHDGYGYHISIDWDGTARCHADLNDILYHASQCNETGIGVVVVNPYYPKNYRPKSIKGQELPGLRRRVRSRWWTHVDKADPGYITPTTAQLETARIISSFLSDLLGVPMNFPTIELGPKKRKITGYQKAPKGWRARPKAGHVSHRDFSDHADGRFILEHIYRDYILHDQEAQADAPSHVMTFHPPVEVPEATRGTITVCPHCGKEFVNEVASV